MQESQTDAQRELRDRDSCTERDGEAATEIEKEGARAERETK